MRTLAGTDRNVSEFQGRVPRLTAAPRPWKKGLGGRGWPQVSARLVPASLGCSRHGFWRPGLLSLIR